ncbi:MAG: M20/M25/M40 family metallo-hydrolase [Vicinamibacterales bacterium]
MSRPSTKRTRAGLAMGVLIALLPVSPAYSQPVSVVQAAMRDTAVQAAIAAARRDEQHTVADQIRFCEVPAPPFQELARARLLRREFAAAGLANVRMDRVGNVLGDRPGTSSTGPRVVIASHLDTVFPENTDVRVRREGAVLHGPGIGDNCRGLAVMMRIVHALNAAGVRTPGTLTFVANVGEEGLGDLRGIKALFDETLPGRIDRFVSIDGAGMHITHTAVGSRRYRVTFKGPGGHSFGAFGLPNPIHAQGRAIAAIGDLQVPRDPRTTFNVGRIGGGTSVNAIPSEAWMEVDMRSSDAAALNRLVQQVDQAIDRAVLEENVRWKRPGVVTVERQLVGDRPAGSLPVSAPIVQVARAVAQALSFQAPLGEGSTDANIAISLGIPAIAIGGGGRGMDVHAVGESFDTTNAWQGTVNALVLAVALAQP